MVEMLYFYGLFIEKGNLFVSKKRLKIMFLYKNHFLAKNTLFLGKTNDFHNKCNFFAPNRAP